MKLFNERFEVYCNEIDKDDERFIENIKENIDKIIAFNECNCCRNAPNRIRIIFYEENDIHEDAAEICVILYSENCSLDTTLIHLDLLLSGKTKGEIYDFVIKAVVNGKKFNLLS